MALIDVHAHLTDEMFDDINSIVCNAKNSGIAKIITAGTNIETSKSCIKLTKQYDEVYCAVGIHPEDIDELDSDYISILKTLAKDKKCVAIGEIGLDYHFREDNKELQKEVFVSQLKLASELNLPIIIHCRDAVMDMLKILKDNVHLLKNGGIFHCFSESVEIYKEIIKLGLKISVGGILTFNNARKLIEVVNIADKDSVMLETDCPYLSPTPLRGTRNEPKNIVLTAQKLAQLWDCGFDKVCEITTLNAENLFWRK